MGKDDNKKPQQQQQDKPKQPKTDLVEKRHKDPQSERYDRQSERDERR